jgi:type I restriction enzyme S subunit
MMAQTDSNVPQIRFKGFEGNWEYKKLRDLAETGFTNGVFNDPNKVGRGYRLINVKDMFSGSSIDVDNLSLIDLDENEFKKNRVQYGDIFFTRSSLVKEGIACSNVNLSAHRDITFDGHLIRMQPCREITDSIFLSYAFKTTSSRRQFILGGKTTTMTTIGQSDIAVVEVALSTKAEQTQIGGYFRELDRLIVLHQRKHDKLVTLKKAMLQKMFPQPGAITPEIRFKGFSGEWVKKKLGELASFSKGQGYSKSDLTVTGTPILLYGSLYVNYQTVISDVATFVTEKKGSIKSIGKEVVVPASGETAEDIARASAIITQGIILGGDLNIVIPFNELDSCFLALTLSNGKPQLELARRAQGKTVVHVRKADLESILIPYPKLDEQQKIDTYFRQLDKLITQHAIQLQKLQQIKSACLAKMFV